MQVESTATATDPAAPVTTAPAEAPKPETPADGATVLEDSAGLSAGFRKVRPEPEEPTHQPDAALETAKDPPAAVEAASSPEAKTEPVQEPVVFAGLTETQLKATLAEVGDLRKTLTDTRKEVLGHVGQLRQALKDAAAAKGTSAAGTPIKVAKEMLKRLNADGYEELADALAEDLSQVLTAPAGSSANVDLEAITKSISEKFDARLDEVNRKHETKLLTLAHKDWKEVYRSDDFKLWKGTLPAQKQQELAASWDSEYIADAITDFKKWREAGKKAAVQQVSTSEAKTAQEKRLAGNVTPRGSATPAPARLPDAAGLGVGFNKVRKPQAQP